MSEYTLIENLSLALVKPINNGLAKTFCHQTITGESKFCLSLRLTPGVPGKQMGEQTKHPPTCPAFCQVPFIPNKMRLPWYPYEDKDMTKVEDLSRRSL